MRMMHEAKKTRPSDPGDLGVEQTEGSSDPTEAQLNYRPPSSPPLKYQIATTGIRGIHNLGYTKTS